jgi:hypothetical protein
MKKNKIKFSGKSEKMSYDHLHHNNKKIISCCYHPLFCPKCTWGFFYSMFLELFCPQNPQKYFNASYITINRDYLYQY